jgi:hypothetical protein
MNDNPENEIDDRNFIEMVTSNFIIFNKLDPYFNSKEYFQKFSEMENAKFNNETLMYNYNPHPFYDMNAQTQKDGKKLKKK